MTARSERLSGNLFWVSSTWTLRGVLSAGLVLPVTYSLLIPFVVLDLWVQGYQAIAFRLLGIRRVRRREYVLIDRHRLGYLNAIQKANCVYCGYLNGLVAFVREVAGRTEQFWCPIRHERRARGQHRRHRRFALYGDEGAFRRVLPRLRKELGSGRGTGRRRHGP